MYMYCVYIKSIQNFDPPSHYLCKHPKEMSSFIVELALQIVRRFFVYILPDHEPTKAYNCFTSHINMVEHNVVRDMFYPWLLLLLNNIPILYLIDYNLQNTQKQKEREKAKVLTK